MNTRALDALAALAAASAVPPPPAPASRATAATNAPSAEVADARALLAAHRRAQQRLAQVQAQRHALAREQALAHRRQHRQEQAHRRAALANLPPDVLRAYLAAASSPTPARDALNGPLPPPPLSLGHMPSVPYAAALDAIPSLDLRAGPFLRAPLPSPQGPLKAARSLAIGPAFGAPHAPTDTASGTTKASGGKRSAPKNETAARAVPPKKRLARARAMSEGGGDDRKKKGLHESVMSEWEDKKEAKRVANRLSAHLSRKRKKLFLEDLKGENQELRRKEQILQSIPDLIVVFDSSGRMPFVSHSVARFLDYAAEELEDTSFWDRLTPGGVRLVKSAFMNALAKKRSEDEDSTPLWDGESRTVRLVDRNDEEAATAVSLKGVVHFAGESPECVCSIRPLEDRAGAASEDDEAAAAGDAAEGNATDLSFNRISDVDSDESKSVPSSRTII